MKLKSLCTAKKTISKLKCFLGKYTGNSGTHSLLANKLILLHRNGQQKCELKPLGRVGEMLSG